MRGSLIALMLLLFSCSEKEHDRVLPQQKEPERDADSLSVSEQKNDTLIIAADLEFTLKAAQFLDKYREWYTEEEVTGSILPMRFASDTLIRFSLKNKSAVLFNENETVYPVGNFYFFSYSDTLHFQNALNNWYNCFGNDCTAIVPGNNLKSIKSTPSFTIIGEKQIVHLNYACEHEGDHWEPVKRELLLLFGENRSELIRVECGGPLKWE